jgi:sigma-B regulation protein RsbU (phosphoserine phosphatase)
VSDGLPIGIVADADYPEHEVHLEPGEVVVAYTDGLVEALDGRREIYGFDRLAVDVEAALAHQRPIEERLDAIISAMVAFTGGEPPADDITIVAVARPGASS